MSVPLRALRLLLRIGRARQRFVARAAMCLADSANAREQLNIAYVPLLNAGVWVWDEATRRAFEWQDTEGNTHVGVEVQPVTKVARNLDNYEQPAFNPRAVLEDWMAIPSKPYGADLVESIRNTILGGQFAPGWEQVATAEPTAVVCEYGEDEQAELLPKLDGLYVVREDGALDKIADPDPQVRDVVENVLMPLVNNQTVRCYCSPKTQDGACDYSTYSEYETQMAISMCAQVARYVDMARDLEGAYIYKSTVEARVCGVPLKQGVVVAVKPDGTVRAFNPSLFNAATISQVFSACVTTTCAYFCSAQGMCMYQPTQGGQQP